MTITDPAAPEATAFPELDEHPERYDLTGMEGVGWALHDLARAEALVRDRTAQRDAAVRALDEWLDRETNRAQRTIRGRTELLHRFALLARERGLATVTTPYGIVKTRKRPDAIPVDKAAFVAAELGERGQSIIRRLDRRFPLLRIDVTPNAGELRKVAKVVELVERIGHAEERGLPFDLMGPTKWWRTGEVAHRGKTGTLEAALDPETGEVRPLDELDRTVLVVVDEGTGRELAGVTVVAQEPGVTIEPNVPEELLAIPLPPVGIVPAEQIEGEAAADRAEA